MDGLAPKHSANALPASPAGALISKMSIRSCQGAADLKSLARIAAGSGGGGFEAEEPEACVGDLKSSARIASGSASESELVEVEPAEVEAAESGASGTGAAESEATEFERVDCDVAEAGKLANSSVKRGGLRRENKFCDPARTVVDGCPGATDRAAGVDCAANGDDAAGDG